MNTQHRLFLLGAFREAAYFNAFLNVRLWWVQKPPCPQTELRSLTGRHSVSAEVLRNNAENI